MKTLLTFAIVLSAAQIAFSQQTRVKDTLPPARTYEGKTLDEWMALTKDKDLSGRYDAALVLGGIGYEAKAAVPALVELLKDKEPVVRKEAVLALGNIGSDAKIAVPALMGLLKD